MTDSSKKVEVRFGAFACTIEGYDDPVAQMREVLGMMQRMISETPALAEAADFNAEQVQDALKDSDEDSTPGVVVIRSADAEQHTTSVSEPEDIPSEPVAAEEAVAVAEAPSPVEEVSSEEAAKTDDATVAFQPSDDDDLEDMAAGSPTEEGPSFADGVATAAAAAGVGTVAAGILSSGADQKSTSEPTPDDLETPQSSTAAWLAAQRARAEAASAAVVEETEDAAEDVGSDAAISSTSAEVETAQTVSDTVDESQEDEPFNIFAAPPSPDPVEPLIETASEPSTADVAEDVATDAAEVAVPDSNDLTVETVSDAITDTDEGTVAATEIESTVAPEPPEPEINIFAAPSTEASTQDATPLPEPVVTTEEPAPTPDAEAENTATPEAGFDAPAEQPAAVNIFATPPASKPSSDAPAPAETTGSMQDPVPEPETEPEPEFTAEQDASSEEPAEEPAAVNIFANPDAASPDPVADETRQAESAAPEPMVETGNIAPEAAPPDPQPTSQEAPPAPESVNIFASAPPPAEPEQPAPATEPVTPVSDTIPDLAPVEQATAPEPEPSQSQGAFNALLKRVQSGAMMGAPGEDPPADQPLSSETSQNISAPDFVERTNTSQVHELLAGSAAWLTLAQGKTRFTRREVMEVFDTLPGDHPKTLEARIKGFGKLVRSGTLILIDDGVFAMAQNDREQFQQYLN